VFDAIAHRSGVWLLCRVAAPPDASDSSSDASGTR
jgi:hypothetical protein